jgi:hypothetical protein
VQWSLRRPWEWSHFWRRVSVGLFFTVKISAGVRSTSPLFSFYVARESTFLSGVSCSVPECDKARVLVFDLFTAWPIRMCRFRGLKLPCFSRRFRLVTKLLWFIALRRQLVAWRFSFFIGLGRLADSRLVVMWKLVYFLYSATTDFNISVANSSKILDKCPNFQDWFRMAQKSDIFFNFVRNLLCFGSCYMNKTEKPKFGTKHVKYHWFLLSCLTHRFCFCIAGELIL